LFRQRYETPSRENVVSFLIFDPTNSNSILSSVTAARENARSIREVISSDMWEHLNEFYRRVNAEIAPNRIVDFLMLDTDFPRSINYCVANADQSVHAITGTPRGMFRNPAERKLGQMRGELAYSQVEEIINTGLHEYLDRLQREIELGGRRRVGYFLCGLMFRRTSGM
jgi:uncharacterized alpha-E superfamily protein